MEKTQIIKNILYEILEENKGWMTMSEIANEFFNKKHPFSKISISAFRFILRHNKDVFINNIKSDSYKLVMYGSKDDVLKNQPLVKNIFDFLNNYDDPKNIDEIVEFVLIYKPNSNKDSVWTAIRKYQNIFLRFKNNFIGLVSKTYSDVYIIKPRKINLDINHIIHKPINTLILDYLNIENEPKSINEIIKELHNLHPELKRGSIMQQLYLNRHNFNKFYPKYIGLITKKYSTDWVMIPKNSKTVTLKELIIEYLHSEELPKHISEIKAYILKKQNFLKGSNVCSILRGQDNSSFIIFENNYYGLKLKEYPNNYNLHNIKHRTNLTKYIFNYLNNEINPKNINEILEHFKINHQYNSLKNLKQYFITKKHLYIKYEKNYFGLLSKEYSAEYVVKTKETKKESIPQLVFEYLEKEENPIHIQKIVDYILQFKPYSNKKSIFTNIKHHSNNRFKTFNLNYIGIKDKEYSKDYIDNEIMILSYIPIKIIAQSFLREEKYPIAKNLIVDYVLKQNPSLKMSSVYKTIETNSEMFSRFKNKLIGLKDKEYPVQFIENI